MKRGDLRTYRRKKIEKKKLWRAFLGNVLLQNAIALVIYIIFKCCGEDINTKAHFIASNCIALTVTLFNLFWKD